MDKNIVISEELLIQIKEMNLEIHFRDIFNFVLGSGAYEKMVSELYDRNKY